MNSRAKYSILKNLFNHNESSEINRFKYFISINRDHL